MNEVLRKLNSQASAIKQNISKECQINEEDIDYLEKFITNRIQEYSSYSQLKYITNDQKSITLLSDHKFSPKSSPTQRILIFYKLDQPQPDNNDNSCFKSMLKKIQSLFSKTINSYYSQQISDILDKYEEKISQYQKYEIIDNKYLLIIYPQSYINYIFLNQYYLPCQFESPQIQDVLLKIDFRCLHLDNIINKLKDCKGLVELVVFDKQSNYLQQQYDTLKMILENNQHTLQKVSLTLPFNSMSDTDIKQIGECIFKTTNLTHFEMDDLDKYTFSEIKQFHYQDKQSLSYISKYQFNKIKILLDTNQNKSQNIIYLKLQLRKSNMDDENVEYLKQYLKTMPNLKCLVLGLSDNKIEKNFSLSLPTLTNLQQLSLDLSRNTISTTSYKKISEELKKCKSLKALMLDLDDNKISWLDFENLFQSIYSLIQLTSLTIFFKDNNISVSSYYKLHKIYMKLTNLIFLSVHLKQYFINQPFDNKIIKNNIIKKNRKCVIINLP